MTDSLPLRQTNVAAFKPGDVLSYVSATYHCRETTAFVTESGYALDTFWQPEGDSQSHALTASELETATVSFNVGDYEELDRYAATSRAKWETFHPNDRGRITSQHGLQEVLFLRRGAEPDLATQIANARDRLAEAESAVRTAEWRLECCRQDLVELEARV